MGWGLIWLGVVGTVQAQVDFVDPGIGSIAHLLEPTRPTVSLPYSMVRVYPIRKDGTDDQIHFFPLTIISHRLGELFSVMPCGEKPDAGVWHRPMTYDQEKLTPYYYSGRLEGSAIQMEFTPAARAGYFRFTFPVGKPVLLVGNRHEGELTPLGTNAFTGIERFNNMQAFVYGEFSVPTEFMVTNEEGRAHMTVLGAERRQPRAQAEVEPLTPGLSPSQIEKGPQSGLKTNVSEVAGKGALTPQKTPQSGGETNLSATAAEKGSGTQVSPERAGENDGQAVRQSKGAGTVEKGSFLLRLFKKRKPAGAGAGAGSTKAAITNAPSQTAGQSVAVGIGATNLPAKAGTPNLPAKAGAPNPGNVIEFRYGISFISIEQARRNLYAEVPAWDFDGVKARARNDWNQALGQIQVEGGTLAQRRLFYSALYRCCERMVNITEAGRYYSGFDRKVHEDARPFYVDNGLWDTYRALEPLQTLLNPEMQADKLQSYVRMYEQSGWMPGFAVVWGNYACMIGNHAAAWMADAWFKGVRGFDLKTGYEGVRKNALEGTMLPWRIGPKCALDDFYHQHGYFPALHPGERETESQVNPFERRQAVSVTLAQSYDDWCTAQLARVLNNEEDYRFFLKRAGNYRNVYRQDKGFMWPKDADGKWVEPFDPQFSGGQGGRDYTTEDNIYIYNWDVQHDYAGLAELMGGNRAAEARLDQLFRADLGRAKYEFLAAFPDSTGLIGQFTIGNQPGMVLPYLYNHFGAPWKTQKRIRQVLDCWFADTPLGFPGDEDEGAMSAFVVFSMMGFYPVVPGVPAYELGSPVFDKVTIRLHNGKLLRIACKHNTAENKYIRSVAINGHGQERVWFRHADVVKGIMIELEMGDTPNKGLGAQENSLPPSGMDLDPRTME